MWWCSVRPPCSNASSTRRFPRRCRGCSHSCCSRPRSRPRTARSCRRTPRTARRCRSSHRSGRSPGRGQHSPCTALHSCRSNGSRHTFRCRPWHTPRRSRSWGRSPPRSPRTGCSPGTRPRSLHSAPRSQGRCPCSLRRCRSPDSACRSSRIPRTRGRARRLRSPGRHRSWSTCLCSPGRSLRIPCRSPCSHCTFRSHGRTDPRTRHSGRSPGRDTPSNPHRSGTSGRSRCTHRRSPCTRCKG